jgi:hypothetical protein
MKKKKIISSGLAVNLDVKKYVGKKCSVDSCLPNRLHLFKELGTRLFLGFAPVLSRSRAKLFALALLRSFLCPRFRAFAFARSRS